MVHGKLAVVTAVALGVAAAGSVVAQERPAITLDEAIQRSERVQPRVVQAFNQVRTADARIRATKGAYLPTLSVSGSGGNFYSEQQGIDPATNQLISSGRTNSTVAGTVSSSIELFDGFRRSADSRAARANQNAALEGLDDAKFQQRLTTTNQFFDVLAALQLVRVRDASVRRAQEQLNVAIARLRAGAAIRSDSLRSLVTLGNARVQLINAETQLATAEANLGRLTGLGGRVSAQDDSSFYRVVSAIDAEGVRVEAMSRSPQVRAAEASARAARATVGVGRSDYWPTVSLRGSASLNGGLRQNQITQLEDFGFRQTRNLSLQVQWDLFNGFRREQTVATQEANAVSADATAAETRRLVQANLTTRLAELGAAEVRIGITQTSLTAATEDLRVQQERYRLGVATILDVLTSQEALTQAEVDAVNARFDYLRAKAQIEALIGRQL